MRSVIGVVVLVAAAAAATGCGDGVVSTTTTDTATTAAAAAGTATTGTATTGIATTPAAAGSSVGTVVAPALTLGASPGVPPPDGASITSRVALPTAATVNATVTATVTGTVRRGGAGCLFLTTDRGQLFGVAGVLDPALSQALPRRDGRPALTSPHGARAATPRADRPGADRLAAGAPGSPSAAPSVRVRASGTVSSGPGTCGSRWTFTVLHGQVG